MGDTECNELTENLLFRLGTQEDDCAKERVGLILKWLENLAAGVTSDAAVSPSLHIYTAGAVLWEWARRSSAAATTLSGIVTLVTEKLCHTVYQCALRVPAQNPDLRRSLGCVLCSLCALQSSLFPLVLQWTGIAKERAADDSKSRIDSARLTATSLPVLAIVCQSDSAVLHFLSCGFLEHVTGQLLDFSLQHLNKQHCNQQNAFYNALGVNAGEVRRKTDSSTGNSLCVAAATALLEFLGQVAVEPIIRERLGTSDAAAFWRPLVALLLERVGSSGHFSEMLLEQDFNEDVMSNNHLALNYTERAQLEAAAVYFFRAVCCLNDHNQSCFAQLLHNALLSLSDNLEAVCLPAFLRRLILQVCIPYKYHINCLSARCIGFVI